MGGGSRQARAAAGLRRLAAALAALAALAGCEDRETITRSQPGGMIVRTTVASLGTAEGLPVEVHGAPFPRMTAEQVVAALEAPADWPAEVRFRWTPPAPHGPNTRHRLALWFEPLGAPDGAALCRYETLAPVEPPTETGFTVTAAFCRGDRRVASAHLEAPKAGREEAESFVRPMRRLLAELARDEE